MEIVVVHFSKDDNLQINPTFTDSPFAKEGLCVYKVICRQQLELVGRAWEDYLPHFYLVPEEYVEKLQDNPFPADEMPEQLGFCRRCWENDCSECFYKTEEFASWWDEFIVPREHLNKLQP